MSRKCVGESQLFMNDRIDCFGEFGAIKCSVLYLSCCVLKIQSFNSKQTKHISKLSASQIFNLKLRGRHIFCAVFDKTCTAITVRLIWVRF